LEENVSIFKCYIKIYFLPGTRSMYKCWTLLWCGRCMLYFKRRC